MRSCILCLPGILATLVTGFHSARGGENWPQFRGPTGLGYTEEKNLPLEWGGTEQRNVLWSAPLTGQGHASPVVWGQRVFVCTAFWPQGVADRAKAIPEQHVACFRSTDGSRLWDVQVPPGPWLRSDFRSGPGGGYAAPTPATDGQRLFVMFGSSVVAALDFDGKILWRKEIVPHSFDVTVGSSPVLFEKNVLVLCAMATKDDSRLVAFEQATGNVAWESRLPEMGFAHSTPVIVNVAGQPQMLVAASGGGRSSKGLMSLQPAGGQLLWWCQAGGEAASVAYRDQVVYVDSGRGGPGVAVDATGSGDVTATHIKWTVDQVPEGIGSPIIVGDYVYRLHTPGILKCWQIADGKQVYAERLNGISSTWASPVADAAGRLYFATAGKSFVIQSGPEFERLAENDLADANHASPAIAAGKIYLVGEKRIYCVGSRN
ncbi:MAG TPA: PQQ-binding-like beta-propeller repeat protein [Pirellulaceae bacterium]|nr:PQQ-binding-like beta-propeller repeat protein [Pirellulaceae bacterium]